MLPLLRSADLSRCIRSPVVLKVDSDIRWINSKAFSGIIFCILLKASNKPRNSLVPMQRRFFFFFDRFSHEFSLSNEPYKSIGKTGDLKLCFEYIYLFLLLLLSRDAHSYGTVLPLSREKMLQNDANNKLIRSGRPGS